ncbi:DHA2 family efflux MFS transporter permease subunit [Deinococcus pimensis]|uniref:DHA2 family efflux MFS transporter permease subunit n=1 Tax=Deinococcus pimensis TaxID=309888 RepID=UPI0004B9A930|nr:DHA2 family efflux MFS transporter permease subunit [Deinococcus pimensis]
MKSAPPSGLSAAHRAQIVTLLTATFVVILNETLLNVALPRLMTTFRVAATSAQWLSTAFMLTMAVVIPTTGYLLQRFPARSAFLLAMSLFCVGTLLAGVAPSFEVLLAARVVQAAGTAVMVPLLMTTTLTLVPPAQQGVFMGNVSVVIAVAPALGPTVAGLILQWLAWRFLFLLVLPVALLVLVRGARHLGTERPARHVHLDVPSVPMSAVGFGGIVYALSQGAGPAASAFTETASPVSLTLGVLSLAAFVGRQLHLQRSERALLDLRVFKSGAFTVSVTLIVVATMTLFGGAILLPMFLQTIRGLSSLQTGFLLLPGGLLMAALAPTVGRMYDRYGPRLLALVGAALLAMTFWQLSLLTAASPVVLVLILHLLLSAGLALILTPVFTSGLSSLPPQLFAHGSAVLSSLQQVGGAVGTALLIVVMTSRTAQFSQAGQTALAAQTLGMQGAFLAAAGAAVLTVVLASFLRGRAVTSPASDLQNDTATTQP